ncbi:MAG: hypothetical protein ABEJ07_03485 [Candidatus Nanohaloarchaea archaeon]
MNRRPGQYLAIESVASFGLGLLIAIGTISAFHSYRDQVVDRAENRQANVVESRVMQAIQTLEETDSGSVTVQLPEKVGSTSYELVLGSEVRIATETGKDYRSSLKNFPNYEFQGSVEGGTAKIYKDEKTFTLRGG